MLIRNPGRRQREGGTKDAGERFTTEAETSTSRVSAGGHFCALGRESGDGCGATTKVAAAATGESQEDRRYFRVRLLF